MGPAGTTTIVKSIYIYNDANVGSTVYLGWSHGPATTRNAAKYSLGAFSAIVLDVWQVIPAGWYSTVYVETATAANWWFSGALLIPEQPHVPTPPVPIALSDFDPSAG